MDGVDHEVDDIAKTRIAYYFVKRHNQVVKLPIILNHIDSRVTEPLFMHFNITMKTFKWKR